MRKPLSVISWVRAVSLAVLLVAVPAAAVADLPQTAQQTEKGAAVKVGVGLGVPYGVFGAGIDVGIPYFSFVAGLGTALDGVSVGLRACAHISSIGRAGSDLT